MLGLLGGLWGKVATAIVGIASLIAAMFGWRYSIRKSQRMEIETQQQAKTLERLRIKDEVERNLANVGGDVRERLRDKGYLRD
jgi:hypothetical protein